MKTEQMNETTTLKQELQDLGFTTAAQTVDQKLSIATKMAIAGEFYRVVTPYNLDRFQKKLMRRTMMVIKSGRRREKYWKELQFENIASYTEIVPSHAREALKVAKDRQCFDRFEIATIAEKHEVEKMRVPDPILFGVINGCSNKYFIAQWDDDVAIEDILKDGEG